MAMKKTQSKHAAKLSLGPLMFNWSAEKWRDFYFRIADEAVIDTVNIGEVVCSKRVSFFEPHLAEVVERLQGAGKEVVLSTLALVMTDREMEQIRAVTGIGEFVVEANDVSTASLLAGRSHDIGPFVNVYNEGTLEFFASQGATRICLPVELSASTLAVLATEADRLGLETEAIVFGRLPLAVSARCYHARAHRLNKDGCEFVCAEDPDEMDLKTLDGVPFLAVNGTQTLSHSCCSLLPEVDAMRDMGVHRFRLSPQDVDMVAVAQVFRGVIDHRTEIAEASRTLEELTQDFTLSNGYFYGVEGSQMVVDQRFS